MITAGRVHWAENTLCKMYDAGGQIASCACGNDAVAGIMGKDTFMVWCAKCSPVGKESEQFIYVKPDGIRKD